MCQSAPGPSARCTRGLPELPTLVSHLCAEATCLQLLVTCSQTLHHAINCVQACNQRSWQCRTWSGHWTHTDIGNTPPSCMCLSTANLNASVRLGSLLPEGWAGCWVPTSILPEEAMLLHQANRLAAQQALAMSRLPDQNLGSCHGKHFQKCQQWCTCTYTP
jgi:hypothetical protein